eukprot:EC825554.1.p1 GENE.EC825554.1~~EC825554.1.p1  ORF type:complete len:141 (+),score=37.95 EC825554.1:19-441(+)
MVKQDPQKKKNIKTNSNIMPNKIWERKRRERINELMYEINKLEEKKQDEEIINNSNENLNEFIEESLIKKQKEIKFLENKQWKSIISNICNYLLIKKFINSNLENKRMIVKKYPIVKSLLVYLYQKKKIENENEYVNNLR